jgi:uncharacterized protein (DUF2147 family)
MERVTMKISAMAMRLIVLALGVALSSQAIADDVLGVWLHESGEAKVRFAPCGDAVCGEIIWIASGADTDARVGDRTFFDMKRVSPDLWRGKTLYPEDGKVYNATMQLDGAVLTTSGCATGGFICESVRWTRVR